MSRKAVKLSPIQRVQAALEKSEVDRPPFSFWHPFGLQHMGGESLAAASLAFAGRYRVDFLVVPLVHQYPLPPQFSLDRPQDFSRLEVLTGTESAWTQQLFGLEEIGKRLRERLWVLQVVPSPWTVLESIAARPLLEATMREHPGFLGHALQTVARSLANFVHQVLGAGAAGMVFELTGASHEVMSGEAYENWCGSSDRQVLEAASGGRFNLLQAQGRRLHFKQIAAYPAPALSWAWHAAGPGLRKGTGQWSGAFAGGLDQGGLHRMSVDQLRLHLREVMSELADLPGAMITPAAPLDLAIRPEILELIARLIEKSGMNRDSQQRSR